MGMIQAQKISEFSYKFFNTKNNRTFLVEYRPDEEKLFAGDEEKSLHSDGLLILSHSLYNRIFNALITPECVEIKRKCVSTKQRRKLQQVGETRIKRRNNEVVKQALQNLSVHFPADKVELHKAAFRSLGPRRMNCSIAAYLEKIKQFPHITSDIKKYVACLPTLVYGHENFYDNKNWRDILSPDGKAYHALHVTIENLKRSLGSLTTVLRFIKLKRPIYNYTELRFILASASFEKHRDIICNASFEQIKKARDIVNPNIKLNKFSGCTALYTYLRDYDGEHNGNIVGLARKSVAYHRELAVANHNMFLAKLEKEKNTATALPPIPLPAVEGVCFLSNVHEVLTEGQEMGHCVGGYAQYAVQGLAYLFSIRYNDLRATAEVDQSGTLKQIQGPKNQPNAACDYGKKILTRWGKGFKNASTVSTLD